MTQTQLFVTLLVTAMMVISAVREFVQGRYAMAAVLVAIPTCGWLSLAFSK